jgi:hypothetical protein
MILTKALDAPLALPNCFYEQAMAKSSTNGQAARNRVTVYEIALLSFHAFQFSLNICNHICHNPY